MRRRGRTWLFIGLGVGASSLAWLLIDAPLEPETRRWLAPPAAPGTHPATAHLAALDAAAEGAQRALSELDTAGHCATIDTRCEAFVVANAERVLAALPRAPAYWDAYHGVLRSSALSAELPDPAAWPGRAYIGALKQAMVRELANRGQLRPAVMVETLEAQRRLLAAALFLMDKMIFTATLGISLDAAYLALQSTPPADPGFDELVHALRPLDVAGRSLRHTLQGELRYMMRHEPDDWMLALFWKRRNGINLQRQELERVVALSELPTDAFWRHPPLPGPDLSLSTWLFDPLSSYMLEQLPHPAYNGYVVNVQLLDIVAAVLRGWADVLSGGQPGQRPAPAAWSWRSQGGAICLEPDADNAWREQVDTVCQPHRPHR